MILDRFEKAIDELKAIEFFIECISNEELNEETLNNINCMLERTKKDFIKIFNEMEKDDYYKA